MRVAIIDLGTNTFNLFVADVVSSSEYKKVFKTKVPVKLGEGGIAKNRIAPAAFQRGIDAMRRYKTLITDMKAEQVFAFATSAIRSAENGKKFIEAVKKETGLVVSIISGGREAEFIYEGVRQAVAIGDRVSLILDIGGGSNEFIIANSADILWKESYDLGGSRILEKFRPSDPVTEGEIKKIEKFFETELASLFEAVSTYPVQELIGASGSFDTFAEMIAHKFHTPEILKGKTELPLELPEFFEIHRQLLSSTKAERLQTKGLVEMRVDMIVIASIFVNLILQKLAIRRMRLSAYSLKEGVLYKLMNRF